MRKELAAIGVRSPWSLLRVGHNFVKTVWDPTRSDVQHGINTLIHGALKEATPERVERLERDRPEVAALYAEGYDPDLSPDRLEALPEGSLGREYVRFIRKNEIDPLGTLLAMGEPKNFLQYLFRRAYKLHDMMHVVLGCQADILGEVRIVSYSLGQAPVYAGFTGRAPGMALAVLFLHIVLRRSEDMKEAVRLAREWMELGERSPNHTGFRLEDWLDRPVEEVRQRVLPPA